MKADNCIPAFGSWWTDMQRAGNERINAANKSLIRKDRPSGGVILPPNVHLSGHDTSDVGELSISEMAAIPADARGSTDGAKPASESLTSAREIVFAAAVTASTEAPAFAARVRIVRLSVYFVVAKCL